MKRRFVILFLLSLLFLPLSAQKLGFVGGPSLTYGALTCKDDAASLKPLPMAGLHVGMQFEMDVTNRWGFDAQVLYLLRTYRWNLSYPDVVPHTMERLEGFLDVPLHFYVNFPMKQNHLVLTLFGGPVFTCGVHAHDWAYEQTEYRRPITELTQDIYDKDKGRIVRCYIEAEVGLALKYKNYQGRISYQHSINNGTNNGYLYTLPLSSAPYLTTGDLRLSFAYLFDLRK